MVRPILSTLLAGTAFAAAAQHAPQASAPLIAHMTEVNAQWRVMDPSPADGARMVRFADDAERIATHLHRVHDHLVAHTPEGLSADVAANRAHLLERLEAYADRGVFPRNYVLPYRNPVFIDPHGTACAVGQLMIESGHRDLAERIDTEMELAYIHQIHLPEVDAWAMGHGFSADELAWIQPGYLPAIPWAALGGGTNDDVTTSLVLGDGRLLVAGAFTQAGGQSATHVAIWDGATFAPLGNGTVDGLVSCAIEHGGNILLGGSFNAMQDLATWDGNAWSYATVFQGKTSQINALHRHEGELYAAGFSLGFAGPMHGVARQDAGAWEPVGDWFNGEVHALASHAGKLVAGGAFTGPNSVNDPLWDHVAILDGGWAQLGDGLDATVFDLLSVGGDLYAGGTLYHNILPRFGIARLADTAVEWEGQLPNLENYLYPWATGPSEVRTLAYADGAVHFGGTFHTGNMMEMGQCLGRLNGYDDVGIFGYFDAQVRTLAVQGDLLVAGGLFTQVNFGPVPHLAVLDLGAMGLGDGVEVQGLSMWPNPAADVLSIELGGLRTRSLVALDAAGRTVLEVPVALTDRQSVDVRGLARGTYTVVLTDADGRRRTGRFVKQ